MAGAPAGALKVGAPAGAGAGGDRRVGGGSGGDRGECVGVCQWVLCMAAVSLSPDFRNTRRPQATPMTIPEP